jgi:hypothetical protein
MRPYLSEASHVGSHFAWVEKCAAVSMAERDRKEEEICGRDERIQNEMVKNAGERRDARLLTERHRHVLPTGLELQSN